MAPASPPLRVCHGRSFRQVLSALHSLSAMEGCLIVRRVAAHLLLLARPRVGSIPPFGPGLHARPLLDTMSLLHTRALVHAGSLLHRKRMLRLSPLLNGAALTHAASLPRVLSLGGRASPRTVPLLELSSLAT